MRTLVKICGITRLQDAALAADLGADAIGFVFWASSPRVIPVADARAIARSVPNGVLRAGVFVDAEPASVAEHVDAVGLDVVQLHDSRSLKDVGYGARVFKLTSVDSDDDVEAALALPAGVTPLVDAADSVRRGGTGRTADWARAARLSRHREIVLAGGLTAANVAQAIALVRPWAVDVSSGVEARPGIKDPARLRAFMEAVSAANGAAR